MHSSTDTQNTSAHSSPPSPPQQEANPLEDATFPCRSAQQYTAITPAQDKAPAPSPEEQPSAPQSTQAPQQSKPSFRAELREIRETHDMVHDFVKREAPDLAQSCSRLTWITAPSLAVNSYLLGSLLEHATSGGWRFCLLSAAFFANLAVTPFLRARKELVATRLGERISGRIEHEFVAQVHKMSFSALADGTCQEAVEEVRSNKFRMQALVSSMYSKVEAQVAATSAVIAVACLNWPAAVALSLCATPVFVMDWRNAAKVKKIEDGLAPVYKELYPTAFLATDKDIATEIAICGKKRWVRDKISELVETIIKNRDALHFGQYKISSLSAAINAVTGGGFAAYTLYGTAAGFIHPGAACGMLGSLTALQMAMIGLSKEAGNIRKNSFFARLLLTLGDKQPAQTPAQRSWSEREISDFRERLQSGPITISLKNVQVRVPKEKEPILDVQEMKIPWGKMIGVVGLKGAGKSTLVNVILGILPPSSGQVSLILGGNDGEPIDELLLENIPLEAWHSHIGYTPQQAYNGYNLTVKDSIDIGKGESDKDAMSYHEAMTLSGTIEFIKPEDIDRVRSSWDGGSNNKRFSGGEVRAIINTRALIGNRKFFILDEPTSGQDRISEEMLVDQLKEFKGAKTQIIVSHSLGALQGADLIIEVNKGKATIGTHGEILAAHGVYYKLRDAHTNGLTLSPEQLKGYSRDGNIDS